MTNDPQEIALDKLRRRDIAALAFVAGKPAPLFLSVKREDGFHFLAIPVNEAAASTYNPTRFSAADYPDLIPQDNPVDTIAVGNVLAVAELRQLPERSRNVANFVDIFFTASQSLLEPGHHSKWNEVNVAADLASLRRYGPARNGCSASCKSPRHLAKRRCEQCFRASSTSAGMRSVLRRRVSKTRQFESGHRTQLQ